MYVTGYKVYIDIVGCFVWVIVLCENAHKDGLEYILL